MPVATNHTNATLQENTHPAAHNAVGTLLNNLENRVGALEAVTLGGDLDGTLAAAEVIGIAGGITIPAPTAGDDQYTWIYDHVTSALVWTPLPSGGGSGGGEVPVQAWQDLGPYLETGWSDYTGDCAYYKDRERVYFRGQIYLDTGVAGAVNSRCIDAMPLAYRSATARDEFLHTTAGSTVAATQNHRWSVFIATDGRVNFAQNSSFSGSPNFGYPPHETVFTLDTLSYRI